MKHKQLNAAIMFVIGIALTTTTDNVSATVTSYSWQGYQTVLDSAGAVLRDPSILPKGANQYHTPISGTLAFDDVSGVGNVSIQPFFFFSSSLPTQASGTLQSIGNGMGGAGSLVLGNMLFDWSGTYGIPISIVLDAAGFFGATSAMWGDGTLDQTDVAGTGAIPASDGTYTNSTWGYLGVGPVPMATTEWNTSFGTGCLLAVDYDFTNNIGGGCMGVSPSGTLPLVVDTAINIAEYAMGDGVGIGGVPMRDGPFIGFSYNLDITEMVTTVVPIPTAVWLFGSGLISLICVARRSTNV